MSEETQGPGNAVPAAGRIVARLRTAVASYRSRLSRKALLRDLQKLSDAELKDIGLARSELPYIATTGDFECQRERLRASRRPRRS